MDLHKIRRTAAKILASAVYETFPEVELLGGSETSYGYFYDFIFPHLIHPELHHQIEEKMRQIVRERREIRDLEMVGASAKEFLKSRGHKKRAGQIEGLGLFSLIEIGSFIDLSDGGHLKNTGDLHAFKLFPPLELGNRVLRVSGTALDSKEALKEFLKKWSQYPKKRHEKAGEVRNYWSRTDDGFLWFSDGIKALNDLVAALKENLTSKSFEIRCPSGLDRLSTHKQILQEKGVESVFEIYPIEGEDRGIDDVGLLDPIEGTAMQITFSLKNPISPLHSIGKTLNILGFSYSVHLSGSRRPSKGGKFLEEALREMGCPFQVSGEMGSEPQIDFIVADGLGREWSAARVRAKECLDVQVVIERNLALLLEL